MANNYDPDRDELRFRRTAQTSRSTGLTWIEVMTAVLVALMIQTVIETVWARYEAKRALAEIERQIAKDIRQMERDLQAIETDVQPLQNRPIVAPPARARPAPLGPDERCAGGIRLRKINGQWMNAGMC